ncbi:hypothetical protein F8388_024395 [Cannabis sativa]|uniref:WRKY domain-containing protein n=1 Tax=Cannabis sativa TaxID=3483 RepID=A0A7J6DSR3_CANSA|nr:hypothetical protein G4B88_031218 [Cannabis sativa]KAF4349127.1 hypothetical protein F8388_024395 [Cannabis sativa]
MAGLDDNVAIIGDWVPPSPSSRAFFSAMLGEDIGSRQFSGTTHNKTEDLFPNNNNNNNNNNFKEFREMGSFSSEQKSNSRGGGLVDRIAARAGFNAPRLNTESMRSSSSDLSLAASESRSPYLTIPPGLSPTTLLDSPVFLSNSLAQPSPTTGKFPFASSNGNTRSSTLIMEASDRNKESFFEDINAGSFAFKPVPNSGPSSSFFLGTATKMTSAAAMPPHPHPSYPNIEMSVQSENSPPQSVGGGNEKDSSSDQKGGELELSPPLEEQGEEEGDQKGSGGDCSAGGGGGGGGGGGTISEDGYNWRKYGQKQVKGSEYPRSYYKCTHPNCQVKKKVERSHEGHITEIIYKGAHNHAKPSHRRSGIGSSSNPLADMRMDIQEQAGMQNGNVNVNCGGGDGDPVWASTQKGTVVDWRNDSLEVTSSASASAGPEYCNQSTSLQAQNGTQLESVDAVVDASSTFSNDEDEDDRGTHGSASLGYEGEEDESESKRRKLEAFATEMSGATRAIREPRVVVQTTSEVDILDDGYRWRKYGQKVVKGNPNPRSYYKCTNAGCTVRKHVERASHDLKSVITTYEGKHNHDVPAARNSSHVNSGPSMQLQGSASTAMQSHVHRPEPSSQQLHNNMGRLSSYSLPRQQLGNFSFGMNQAGLANLAMAGLGSMPPKLQGMPMNPYLAQQQQRQANEMSFMLPKGEPKAEPISESATGLNLSNASVYQQFMSRLPLGPQM